MSARQATNALTELPQGLSVMLALGHWVQLNSVMYAHQATRAHQLTNQILLGARQVLIP